MCLDKVTKRFTSKKSKAECMTAYKVVELNAWKEYVTPYYVRRIKLGKWNVDSSQPDLVLDNLNRTQTYQQGFHFYKKYEDVKEWVGGWEYCDCHVLECIVSDLVCEGKECGSDVVVARSFRAMREM